MEKLLFETSSELNLKKGQGQGAALLLHGYQQDGQIINSLLSKTLEPFFSHIYAPDAPFPVPYKKNDVWKMGFGWYFYDNKVDHFYVDMNVAVLGLDRFLNSIEHSEITIIGYSQGGYLLPFLANKNEKVNQALGINCRYRVESLSVDRQYTLDSIHATDDPMVDFVRSKSCFDQLQQKGARGKFIETPGGHGISQATTQAVTEILKERS